MEKIEIRLLILLYYFVFWNNVTTELQNADGNIDI